MQIAPVEIGKKYDKIAAWWHEHLYNSNYGIKQMERAINFCANKKSALDIGCGSGRFLRKFTEHGFMGTGIDISAEMLAIARSKGLEGELIEADFLTWETDKKFDLITSWDSLFHIPFEAHESAITKLCGMLDEGGVIMYTLGNSVGEHVDTWHNDTFYYSSIGIEGNLDVLRNCGLSVLHLELDQMPDRRHVYIIAQKLI